MLNASRGRVCVEFGRRSSGSRPFQLALLSNKERKNLQKFRRCQTVLLRKLIQSLVFCTSTRVPCAVLSLC